MSVEATVIVGAFLLVTMALGALLLSFRVLYPVVFALLALFIAAQPWMRLSVQPDVLLALLIPPLLFYSAFHIDVQSWRLDRITLLTVGVFGTFLAIWGIAGIITYTFWFDWVNALLLGALLVAMDPAAVRQVMSIGHAPRRLVTLAESEHLFSSLIPLIILPIWVAVTVGDLTLGQSVPAYIQAIGGGIGVGILVGSLAGALLSQESTRLSTLVWAVVGAYGSYLLAWQLRASGALATAVAGGLCGAIFRPRLQPTSKVALSALWELAAFVATAMGFLLAGFVIPLPRVMELWIPVLWAVLAALLLRVVLFYVLGLIRRGLGCTIPLAYYTATAIGGMRGAIGLLLALSLPARLIRQADLQAVAFGAILMLAVVQGLLSLPLLRFFRLSRRPAIYLEYQRLLARLLGVRAARQQLSRMYQEGAVAPHAWETVDAELGQQEMLLLESVQDFATQHPEVQQHSLVNVRREALRAQQHMLVNLSQEGIISSQVAVDLISRLKTDLEQLNEQEVDLPPVE